MGEQRGERDRVTGRRPDHDDPWRAAGAPGCGTFGCRAGCRQELRHRQDKAGFGVGQLRRDLPRRAQRIDPGDHPAGGERAAARQQPLRRVRGHDREHVPRPQPERGERRGYPAHSLGQFAVVQRPPGGRVDYRRSFGLFYRRDQQKFRQ
jgi:hypothetical protein